MTKQIEVHAVSARSTPVRRRLGALASALAVLLASCAALFATAPAAFAGPVPVQFGFVPMPADQFQLVMEHVNSAADSTIDFTVGITSAASGAVITYDHWEDGYEADLSNPVQATTQVWGDGNALNGDASTVCSVCSGDVIPQGAVIVGRNSITTPRNSAQIRYDGRDEVASTRGFALTAGGFSTPLGSVLAGSVSAFDTSTYGTDYVVPVGENTPTPAGTSPAFEYTGAVVMAAEDNTTVHVDTDGNGTDDQTSTIDRGEVVFVDGGLSEGAHITSSKPVQVHLATGDKAATYESRWFTLFPTPLLTSDYLSPVGSSDNNQRTIIYLFNPNASSITITPTCTSCAGTLTVPAHTSTSFATPVGEAVRFASSGSEPFLGIGGAGSQSGAAPGSAGDGTATYDWGFTLIPTRLLTTQAVLGWAPGNSTNPPSGAGAGHADDDPVWITTLTATTLHVDYDGDPSTGAISTPDCFGAKHDADIAVGALASTRIVDASDSDMTGARVYTCDSTKIAGAWGEDPANAPTGSPGFDAGYTLIPSTIMIVDKSAAVFTDTNSDGKPSPGDTLTYDVSIADAGSLAFTNVAVDDALPAGVSYVPNSTVFDDGITTTPISDDSAPPAATTFPLDEGGAPLPNVSAGATVNVRYRVTIDNPFDASGTSVTNTASVTADEASASDTNVVQFTEADLSLTKGETASPVHVGDNAVFHITVSNAGPDTATSVEVTDLLPGDATYVSDTSSQGTYDDSSGLWTVGSLANGASATLDITATVDDTSVTNFAEVTAADAADPDSQPGENALDGTHAPDQDDEDSVTVTTTQASADLSLTKDETAAPVHVGDNAVFHITVSNAGPDTATGVEVTDLLPADATYVSDTPSQGTYDDSSGLWTVGSLANGASATLDITATVDDTSVTNFAEVTAADISDPDSQPGENTLDGTHAPDQDDEDSVTVTTTALSADLSLTKTQTGAPLYVGDNAVFHITVSNAGPDTATGVEVTDLLPADATYVSDTPSQGTYDDSSGLWTVGSLSNGASATLDITATVDDTSVTNFAEVTAADISDPDSQPGENALDGTHAPDQDDEDSVTVTTTVLQTAALGDTVWFDRDGDGTRDAGEPGLSGVDVSVRWAGPDGTFGTGDDVVTTVTTDANGIWHALGLAAGHYRVTIDTATLPAGTRIPTHDFDGIASANRADVTLASDQVRNDLDFGYSKPATVGDTVFNDANGNDVADPGEGMPGVKVTVTSAGPDGKLGTSDDINRTATTNASGVWSITGLSAGPVQVRVEILQSSSFDGLLNTYDPDGGFDSESRVVLAAGTTNRLQDFAYTQPATFGDHVWIDSNGNGLIDTGELGVSGVTITLLRDTDGDGVFETTIGTTTTDSSGDYEFAGLRFGTYRALIDTSTAPNGSALTTPDHVDVDLTPGEVSGAGDFGLSPSLLPFTGANPMWLLRLGGLLLVAGTWFAHHGRRRSATVLRDGWIARAAVAKD